MQSYRHIQFAEDGVTVIGISTLAAIEKDRPCLMYFPITEENAHITFGWRYIDGTWYEPLPPTEEHTLSCEFADIEGKLRQLYEEEKYEAWRDDAVTKPNKSRLNAKKELLSRQKEIEVRLSELHRKGKK